LRILVLSFYYEPDLCAGSFRCTSLVEQLLGQDENCDVDVISTLPNRYASFAAAASRFEQKDRLNIHRVKLPSHKSGMFDQAKSFISYYREAIKLTKNSDYDVVVATSSRLFTAFLGKRIASKKRLPLYLDIRDIFVDTLNNVLSKKLSFVLSPMLRSIENYTFKSASKINLVSKGFLAYFESRYPAVPYDCFTNGIDKQFIQVQSCKQLQPKINNAVKTIVYAGNFGEGQGLHRIVPQLASKLGDTFILQIIGDGGKKPALVEAIEKAGVSNVQLLPPISRSELIEYYQNADVLFLHLNDYDAFKKVLPSKLFEYAAFNKPILAGVSGFAAEFIKDNIANATVFYPCDVDGAVKALESLSYECEYRVEFVKNYLRENIMSNMSTSILSLAKSNNQHD
jgi:glycosyltransferase involved in cell wall biosynthesis